MICLSPVRRLVVVGVLVAALAVGACADNNEPVGPTATLAQPTTTTDPYAVPPVIDEAYVNRVLAGLDKAVGDVVRLVVSSRTISPAAIERLEAFYIGDALQLQVDLFQNDMFDRFAGYRESPGDQVTTVTKLIDASDSCIFAEVHKDLSAVSLNPNPRFAKQWVALVPAAPGHDRSGVNKTRWVFLYDGFRQDFTAPASPCADS
jgi:hypothetical protein